MKRTAAAFLVPMLVGSVVLLGALAPGCATGGGGTDDAGPITPSDGGPSDGNVPRDSGAPDAGRCGMLVCGPFEYCATGNVCRTYPACNDDGSCADAGAICRNDYCVPRTADLDGDGSPAADDCDESDPMRRPGMPERCDGVDDDCDTRIDEGDPAALCVGRTGICIEGSCGCPEGRFDIDPAISGCECIGTPSAAEGATCDAPIDLGNIVDTGERRTVSSNVLPADRTVWYTFRAIDTPDTSCDAYHVRAQFTNNPGNAFEFTVSVAACSGAECGGSAVVDYRRAVDFGGLTTDGSNGGECPCWAPPAAPQANVTRCTDNSQTYFVGVRRRPGSTLSCAAYELEISNGVYD